MGLRFRKRIKVLPGVYLNVSGTGTSWTLGRRGASVSLGRGKTHANVGLPGSGLSFRERIDSETEEARASQSIGASVIGLIGSLIQLAIVAAIVLGGLWFLLL